MRRLKKTILWLLDLWTSHLKLSMKIQLKYRLEGRHHNQTSRQRGFSWVEVLSFLKAALRRNLNSYNALEYINASQVSENINAVTTWLHAFKLLNQCVRWLHHSSYVSFAASIFSSHEANSRWWNENIFGFILPWSYWCLFTLISSSCFTAAQF